MSFDHFFPRYLTSSQICDAGQACLEFLIQMYYCACICSLRRMYAPLPFLEIGQSLWMVVQLNLLLLRLQQMLLDQLRSADQDAVVGNLPLWRKLQLMTARIYQKISPGGEEVLYQSLCSKEGLCRIQ